MRKTPKFADKGKQAETKAENLSSCFKFVLASLFLENACLFFLNPFHIDRFSTTSVLYLTGLFVLLLSTYLMVRTRYAGKDSMFTALMIVLLTVGANEFHYGIRVEHSSDAESFAAFKHNIEIMKVVLLTSHIDWSYKVSVFMVLSVYDVCRFQVNKPLLEFDKLHYTAMIVEGLIIFSTLYEKNRQRRLLNRLARYEDPVKSLNTLQILKNIASSIIIYRKEEIVFFNDVTKSIFEVSARSELKKYLGTVKVLKRVALEDFKSLKFLPEQCSKEWIFSLDELLKDWEDSLLNNEPGDFQEKFMSFEGELSFSNDVHQKSLFIQIGKCLWDDKQSLILIISDMTPIRKHYQYLDDFKENMLAKVSHNLRTPLNGIMGNLEVMMIERDGDQEKLNAVYSSARLLLSIVNDIIDFSEISRGKFKLCPELTNPKALLLEVKEIFALQAEKKNLALKIENEVGRLDYMLDRARLKQILINLVGNAVKFTKEGCVSVRVRELKQESKSIAISEGSIRRLARLKSDSFLETLDNRKTKSTLIFEVEDTGPGINTSEIHNLFDFGGHKIIKDTGELRELGFGLPISQSLVFLLNSKDKDEGIIVESVVGKGSKFYFKVPADKQQADRINTPRPLISKSNIFDFRAPQTQTLTTNTKSEEDELIIPRKSPLKVLITDDDQINLLVASNYLKSSGGEYEFITAMNGKQALETVILSASQGIHFDVFLMDCNMPIMDGYEASRELKLMMKNETIKRAPIIANTANFGSADKEKCFSNGMDYFLTKPFTRNQLLSKINEALLFL